MLSRVKMLNFTKHSRMNYTLLDWDSQIFGYKVAKLLPTRLSAVELAEQLDLLRAQQVKLCYWATDSQDLETQVAAQKHAGFLADQKSTYLLNLKQLPIASDITANIVAYPMANASTDLTELAYQSGLYSRFRADPTISEAIFKMIYTQWINNSCLRKIATEVLVIYHQQRIVAMITLGDKQGRGDIGLLAVAEDCRSLGYGSALVQAAQANFLAQKYEFSQVVTQASNLPACRLYEKMGYQLEKVENFYHFWL